MGSESSASEITFVPGAGIEVRYALAVATLILGNSKAVILAAVASVVGGIWWALVGIQRGDPSWWLGFVVVGIVGVGLFFAFALAVYVRELRSPTFVRSQRVTVSLRPDLWTFEFSNGTRRIRPSDIDGIRFALGFALLRVSVQGRFLIVPRRLLATVNGGS